MTNSEFRSLLEAAVRGNSDALTAIFELYMPLINRLSRYNGQLDEDCRQFILIRCSQTKWTDLICSVCAKWMCVLYKYGASGVCGQMHEKSKAC